MRGRTGWSAGVVAVMMVAVPVAHATDLRTAGGLLFDVIDTAEGWLNNGSIDAYDGCYSLTVNTLYYSAAGQPSSPNLEGRGVKTAEVALGDLRIRRLVYVPKTAGDYARLLDVIVNVGASEVPVTIAVGCNLGSDSATIVPATSSGDLAVDVGDQWIATDDLDASGDPSLAHVVFGPAARVRPTAVSLAADNLNWEFRTSVPAGGRVALLTFAVQAWSQSVAQAEAWRLVALPADALVGIESYRADIVNF